MSAEDQPQGAAPAPAPAPAGEPPNGKAWLRPFARLWGFALFLVAMLVLFREVLLPFIFAVTIAYVLAPVVARLAKLHIGKRHIPRGLAVIICYVVVLTSVGVFLSAFLPRLSADFARLGAEAPKLWDKAQGDWTPAVARWLEKHFPSLVSEPEPAKPPPERAGLKTEADLPPGTVLTVTPMASGELAITLPPGGVEIEHRDDKHFIVRAREEVPRRRLEDMLRERMMKLLASLEGQLAELVRFGQALITGAISVVMQLVLVLMVAAFLLIDLERVHAFLRSVVPAPYRKDYEVIVAGIDEGLNGVVRGQLLVCLINGILTYIGLLIFQVKYGLLLAAVAAVMSLIPIFGSILSTIPIVLIALVSSDNVDLLRAVAILCWILGIHFIESNFLSPRIMSATTAMHPVLVVFSLIAGEHFYGIVGALLAVPVASIIQFVFVYVHRRAWQTENPQA